MSAALANPLSEMALVRRRFGNAALPEMVDLFCRAFERDAHINWLVRQDAGRSQAMRALFRLLLAPAMGGELHTTTDGKGAALWFAPDTKRLGWVGQTDFFLRYLGIAGPVRALSRGLGLKRMETRHPERPHFYLQLLAVEPEFQGRGHGSALLATLLTQSDLMRQPVYLETSSAANVAFYTRMGFGVVAETRLSAGLRLWSLLREPNSSR